MGAALTKQETKKETRMTPNAMREFLKKNEAE